MSRSQSAKTESHFSSKTSFLIWRRISSSGAAGGGAGEATRADVATRRRTISSGRAVLNIRSGPLRELVVDEIQPEEKLAALHEFPEICDLLRLRAVVEGGDLDEEVLEIATDVFRAGKREGLQLVGDETLAANQLEGLRPLVLDVHGALLAVNRGRDEAHQEGPALREVAARSAPCRAPLHVREHRAGDDHLRRLRGCSGLSGGYGRRLGRSKAEHTVCSEPGSDQYEKPGGCGCEPRRANHLVPPCAEAELRRTGRSGPEPRRALHGASGEGFPVYAGFVREHHFRPEFQRDELQRAKLFAATGAFPEMGLKLAFLPGRCVGVDVGGQLLAEAVTWSHVSPSPSLPGFPSGSPRPCAGKTSRFPARTPAPPRSPEATFPRSVSIR